MKFSLNKDNFLEGLQQVQSVVSTRTTLPILSNVLIQADKSHLRMTTTDLDVGVRGSIEAKIEEPGATTLPARRLFSIIRELPSGEIHFETDANQTTSIRCGHSFFRILGLAQEEFPPFPEFEGSTSWTVAQSVLKDALKKTSYAISSDETRYVLNGILCVFRENHVTLVATDGRRLAMVELDVDIKPAKEFSIIIPAKAVNELQRSLKDEGDIRVKLGSNQIAFELNNTVLVSKLIEGNYPNYKQVIPSAEVKERIALERETFLNAVRRVALLTSEKSSSIKLILTKNNIDITANSPEIGDAKESLAVKYTGRDLTIAFNPEFLIAPLRNLSNDEIYLELTDEMSPGVIKINAPFLYVLMPMRVTY